MISIAPVVAATSAQSEPDIILGSYLIAYFTAILLIPLPSSRFLKA
jgi:hypothetical protein